MDRLKNYFIKQNISYTNLNNIVITGYKEINDKNKYLLITAFDLLENPYNWELKYKIKKITRYYIHNNSFMHYAYTIDIKYYDSLVKEIKKSTICGVVYNISCDKLILVYFYISDRKSMNIQCCIDANKLINFNDRLNYKGFL